MMTKKVTGISFRVLLNTSECSVIAKDVKRAIIMAEEMYPGEEVQSIFVEHSYANDRPKVVSVLVELE